jgi:hypothetical protein
VGEEGDIYESLGDYAGYRDYGGWDRDVEGNNLDAPLIKKRSGRETEQIEDQLSGFHKRTRSSRNRRELGK